MDDGCGGDAVARTPFESHVGMTTMVWVPGRYA
jgi:hypothetical protein